MNVEADFLVGDARFLPFADSAFDTVFCYSVLQHFSKENARMSLDEVARVLKKNGVTLIQMPNKYGIRQYQQHRPSRFHGRRRIRSSLLDAVGIARHVRDKIRPDEDERRLLFRSRDPGDGHRSAAAALPFCRHVIRSIATHKHGFQTFDKGCGQCLSRICKSK
jgi:SAM-dependent methyltransferase